MILRVLQSEVKGWRMVGGSNFWFSLQTKGHVYQLGNALEK